MAPLRGWSPRGERLLSKAPYGHWNTMTFIAALRHDRIEAPWLLDGPVDGESFLLYVQKAGQFVNVSILLIRRDFI
jgi:putative transposase